MKFGTARRITANFASLATAEITSKIVQALIFIYLARFLGKNDFGIFSFSISFSLIFMILADFGMGTLFVREISRKKEQASKFFSHGLAIKAVLAAISLALGYTFLNIMGYPQRTVYVACIMLMFAALQSFTELHFSIFRAFEKMNYEMLLKIVRILSIAGLVLYLTKNGHGIIAASLVFPLTEFIILIFAFIIVNAKFAKVDPRLDFEFSKSILKESYILFFSLLFATLYLYVDVVMLSKMRTNAEVGIYSAASNIIIALIFVPLMYANSIYPTISRFYITSKKSLAWVYEKSFKYMFVLGCPIAAGLFILADKIINFLYGQQYAQSAAVLMVWSGYILLKFLNPVSGYTLLATDQQHKRLAGHGAAAAINIMLNFILIPAYGIIGAAFATLITEIIFTAIYCSFMAKFGINFKFLKKFSYKVIIAVLAMAVTLSYIGNLAAAIIVGASVYIAVIFLLRVIDDEDKNLFNRVARNT